MRALVALGMVAGALLMATPAQAGLGRVVALGDSFATGTGLGTQLPGSPPSCDRTDGGFPELAMDKASRGDFINQTCNGATTQALFHGYGNFPEQTSVLDGSERVVILAIGDNNAQFGAVTNNCLVHASNITGDVCASTYGSGAGNQLPSVAAAGITTTQGFAPSVSSTLDQIHAKSPLAKIFLVGYLRIAPPDGVACDTPFDSTWPRSYLNLTPNDAPVFAAWEDTINASLASEAAGRSFVHFIDMQPESIAHNACNPAAERWVNPFPQITPDAVDGLSLHPSSAGAAAVTSALLGAMTAEGLNLGPDIAISSPADGSYTTAATAALNYSATSSLGAPDCTPESGSSISLSPGPNTFSVSCSDSAGNLSSSETTVNRGDPPVVTITAPGVGTTHTTASSVNVAYSVDGSTTIPDGTTCNVGEFSSADSQVNPFPLTLGNNTITVSCINLYGTGSASFAIERGVVPAVVITQPVSDASTSSSVIDLSFTVSGNAAIPETTTCTVNDSVTTSATTNAVALSAGLNEIAVACSNQFGESSQTISVTRGDPPAVAITEPSVETTHTTASSVNLAYTVDGSSSIPAGTTCTVSDLSSTNTQVNAVSLAIGGNTITVSCTNAFGAASASSSIERGSVPSLAIVQPTSGTWTASEFINVVFTVDGSSTIPPGTTCAVNETETSSANVNAVALSDGPNTIELSCSNAFGSSSTVRGITRGDGPAVAITDPQNGSTTTATSTIVAFTSNGSTVIPPGTTCSVGSSSTTSTSANLVNLGLGANTITVSCTNEVGSDQQSIVVTRSSIAETTPTPTPTPPSRPLVAEPLSVSLSNVSPSRFTPLKKGKPFSRTSRKGGARIRVTLSAATGIRVRVEQLGGRKVRTRWTKFALPAGVSTLRLSGRAAKRALKPGRYRIRLSVIGTNQSRNSRQFRIDR